jgi:hypothetical protein
MAIAEVMFAVVTPIGLIKRNLMPARNALDFLAAHICVLALVQLIALEYITIEAQKEKSSQFPLGFQI